MRHWNQRFFWALVIIAFSPFVFSFLVQASRNGSPTALIVAGLLLLFLLASLLRFLSIGGLLSVVWHGLGGFVRWLFFAGRRWEGARYLGPIATAWFLRPSHNGWLIDGKRRRLSEKVSYQSLLTVGGMGKGKSSVFVIPNLLTLEDRSLVVTDTSGEIYDQTAGHLESQGFDIQRLNLMELDQSQAYNPLANLRSFTDIQQVAHLIIKSAPGNANASDPFWNAASEKILRIIIQALYNLGQSDHLNLNQVKRWLNEFEVPGGPNQEPTVFDRFVLSASDSDPSLWQDYKGFLRGNPKSLSSVIMTADVALSAMSNPDISNFVARHEFDFQGLRDRKTALYVMVRQQDLSYYAFLLNLFYVDLFRHLLADRDHDGLPVYLLLDEFGHFTIPDMAIYATTARKYGVAFWLSLQSLSQLESRYGRQEAQTIMEGLGTEIYMGGLGIETAEKISRRVGRKRRRDPKEKSMYGEINLLNPDEIINLEDDEVLMLHSNKRPIRYRVTPFFRQWGLRRRSQKPAP